MSKQADSVFVVTRRNEDMKEHMVEIMGVFKSREEAMKHRQFIWDKYNLQTYVLHYSLLDSVPNTTSSLKCCDLGSQKIKYSNTDGLFYVGNYEMPIERCPWCAILLDLNLIQ